MLTYVPAFIVQSIRIASVVASNSYEAQNSNRLFPVISSSKSDDMHDAATDCNVDVNIQNAKCMFTDYSACLKLCIGFQKQQC